MQIVHFERLPTPGDYSIERVFGEIRRALPEGSSASVVRCATPFHSKWWLLRGIVRARILAGDVNHITGHVHFVALGLPKCRTILTVHDLNRLDQLTGLRKRLYAWLFFSLPLRRCRFVTAISQATRDRLVELFPFVADKITVVPDCVPGSFVPKPRQFNHDCPRILQIGTEPHKNLERLARAVKGLRCILHVIGRLSEQQRTLLGDLGLQWEDAVDLPDAGMLGAYHQADLVAFPSLAEGFGMPIIEAQAIGRALLTSDLPPMKDVAGSGACLVDPFDVNSIRAGIVRIIEDHVYREELIAKGFENCQRYDARVVASAYAALYDEVARLG